MADKNEFVLPYEPILHDLVGLPVEQRRHLIARAALMNELRFDTRLSGLLDEVSEKTGIQALRLANIEAKNDFAFAVGVDPDRVLKTSEWPTFRSKGKRTEVINAGSLFLKRFNEFGAELENQSPEVTRRLLELTRDEWDLPFPWLPLELLFIFVTSELGSVLGTKYRATYFQPDRLIKEPILIPAGTSELRAIDHLKAEIKSLQSKSNQRRFQRPDEQLVKRNARWFYRVKIRGDSISSIAREYHEAAHPKKARCAGDRSIVQSGIREVTRLLGLTRFHIPASPAKNSH